MRSILLAPLILVLSCVTMPSIPPPPGEALDWLTADFRPDSDTCASTIYADPQLRNYPLVNYVFTKRGKTKSGIRFDDNGSGKLDLAELDRQAAALEQCVGKPFRRCGVAVKIAPDAKHDTCNGLASPKHKSFPCNIDDAECPRCLGAVQYPGIAVITDDPDLPAWRHELLHIAFGLQHGHPFFAKCENDPGKPSLPVSAFGAPDDVMVERSGE